ncbi:MAG: hypothetical protein NVS1B4_25180 [Gemmatimonadaceae bacterium]
MADSPPTPPSPTPRDAMYDPDELRAMRRAYGEGQSLRCPRDDTPMTSRPVGGGSVGLG